MQMSSEGQNGSSKAAAIGTGLGTAFRLLKGGSSVEGSKLAKGLFAGSSAFLQAVTRVARILFHQVMGFLFLCFGVFIGSKAVHEYRQYSLGQADRNRFLLAAVFAIIFVYFGLSSFWRARK